MVKRKKPPHCATCATCGQPLGSHLLNPCHVCLREGERRGLLRAARLAAKWRRYRGPGSLELDRLAQWCHAEVEKLKETS